MMYHLVITTESKNKAGLCTSPFRNPLQAKNIDRKQLFHFKLAMEFTDKQDNHFIFNPAMQFIRRKNFRLNKAIGRKVALQTVLMV